MTEATQEGRGLQGFLREVPLFAAVPNNELALVVQRLEPVRFDPGTVIIAEGDQADACYIIMSGSVKVTGHDLTGAVVELATLGIGASLGEVALASEAGVRTATVTAADTVLAMRLDRATFDALAVDCPEFAHQARTIVDLLSIDTFLRKASPFAHLPDETLQRLGAQLKAERVHPGHDVVVQGEQGDTFYLIRSGSLEVLRDGRRVQVLQGGDFFGEVALLANVPRTATVRALADSEVLVLPRSAFDAVVQQHGTVRREFREFLRIRVGSALAESVGAIDPVASLMPARTRSRGRYWGLLGGGVGLFAALSLVAIATGQDPAIYAAVVAGAAVAPVVYFTYLRDARLVPGRPMDIAIALILAAVAGVPLAAIAESLLGLNTGNLASAGLVALIEESAKVVGVAWLFARSTSRFQLDGVVYGAAAGIGFTTFETLALGLLSNDAAGPLLAVVWPQALLAPFAQGAWTALVCGALWAQRGGVSKGAGEFGAVAAALGLHTLWLWRPVPDFLVAPWLVLVMVASLLALRAQALAAAVQEVELMQAVNPGMLAMADETVTCQSCGYASPAGARYCPRCSAALRT